MYLNEAEASKIASKLKITIIEFVANYCEERESDDGILTSLRSKPERRECVFLENNKCSIYDTRPTQCATYPWWPQNLMGKSEWRGESFRCEGIKEIKIDMEDSLNVSKENIMKELIVHQVHAKGLGPNFTYKESVEYLDETVLVDGPSIVSDFQDEFFSTHHSTLIFENEEFKVIDSTFPEPAGVTHSIIVQILIVSLARLRHNYLERTIRSTI